MAVTFHVHHQQSNVAHTRIEKVLCLRTACLYAHSTCNFFLGILGGKGWQLIIRFGRLRWIADWRYLMAIITWLMPGILMMTPRLLTPYHGVHYHLTEWSQANQK